MILLSAVAILPGCLPGNGEGVGANNRPGSSNPFLNPIPGTFYDLDPATACNHRYGTRIIILNDGSMTWTDVCTGESKALTSSDIVPSNVGYWVGYQSGIFELRAAEPNPEDATATYAEAFCVTSPAGAEVTVHGGPGLPERTALVGIRNGTQWTTLEESVTLDGDGSRRRYAGSNLELGIDLGSDSLLPDQYPGELRIDSETPPRAVSCWVAKKIER